MRAAFCLGAGVRLCFCFAFFKRSVRAACTLPAHACIALHTLLGVEGGRSRDGAKGGGRVPQTECGLGTLRGGVSDREYARARARSDCTTSLDVVGCVRHE